MIKHVDISLKPFLIVLAVLPTMALSACHPHGTSTNGTDLKPAQGWTSGGGNAAPVKPASEQEIRTAISTAQYWMPFIFNAIGFDTISMATTPVQPEGDNYKKLFGTSFGPAPIQLALNKMTVRIEDKQPCISPLGEEDGAAYRDGSICISLARLQGKLSSDTVFIEVAALLGREASHLVGFNEDDAGNIQQKIRKTIHEELMGVENSYSLIDVFSRPSWVGNAAWEAANAVREGQSEGAICAALNRISDQQTTMVAGFSKAAAKYGAWPISSVDYDYYTEVLWFKTKVIITQYCGGNQYDNNAIGRIFANTDNPTIEEADLAWMEGNTYHSQYDDPRHRPMKDVYVQKIAPGDHLALRKELFDLQVIDDRIGHAVEGITFFTPIL